jgi:hypothetical protein
LSTFDAQKKPDIESGFPYPYFTLGFEAKRQFSITTESMT